jgi:hypothetical protein
LYNDLAGRVSRVVSATYAKRPNSSEDAIVTLRRIVDVRLEEWDRAVAAFEVGAGVRS